MGQESRLGPQNESRALSVAYGSYEITDLQIELDRGDLRSAADGCGLCLAEGGHKHRRATWRLRIPIQFRRGGCCGPVEPGTG